MDLQGRRRSGHVVAHGAIQDRTQLDFAVTDPLDPTRQHLLATWKAQSIQGHRTWPSSLHITTLKTTAPKCNFAWVELPQYLIRVQRKFIRDSGAVVSLHLATRRPSVRQACRGSTSG